MSSVTVGRARDHFSDLLRRAEYGGERVIVHRHGKPVAAIVSTDDLRRLEALEDAGDVADARASLQEARKQGTLPLEVVLRKHGLEHLLANPAGTNTGGTVRKGAARKGGPAPRQRGLVAQGSTRQPKNKTRPR